MSSQSEFLTRVSVQLEEAQLIGPTSGGIRQIVCVKSGSFQGPKLSGEVLPGGGDWFLMCPDGTGKIDVRGTLRAENGDLIYVHYPGIVRASPDVFEQWQGGEAIPASECYFRTTPVFETASETYGWLNHTVNVGVGRFIPGGVAYNIYTIL